MIFDLHSHTYFSDGMLSPEALIARAKERGVSVLAITDHDTIAGVRIAQKAALDAGITLISGIEFSVLILIFSKISPIAIKSI